MQTFLHNVFYYLIYIDLWIIAALFVGTALLFTRWWQRGRGVVTFAAILVLLVAVLPFGTRWAATLEDRFPKPSAIPSHVVGAILLGGSFDRPLTAARGEICYNAAAGRLFAFADLARKNPKLRLAFTGGGKPNGKVGSEAALFKQVFDELGIDTTHILLEDKSTDTAQNAKFSYELVKPQKEDVWLLVTSALHMPRAMGLFRQAGWNVIAFPVDYHTKPSNRSPWFSFDLFQGLMAWRYAVREWAGLVTNYLTGTSADLFPKP